MDILSILSSVSSLAEVSAKVVKALYGYGEGTKGSCETIRVLSQEINSVRRLVGAIGAIMEDPYIRRAAQKSLEGGIKEPWDLLIQSLESCRTVMWRFAALLAPFLEQARSKTRKLLQKSLRHVKLSLKSKDIVELRRQIQVSYIQMETAFQMIQLYGTSRREKQDAESYSAMNAKLDTMMEHVERSQGRAQPQHDYLASDRYLQSHDTMQRETDHQATSTKLSPSPDVSTKKTIPDIEALQDLRSQASKYFSKHDFKSASRPLKELLSHRHHLKQSVLYEVLYKLAVCYAHLQNLTTSERLLLPICSSLLNSNPENLKISEPPTKQALEAAHFLACVQLKKGNLRHAEQTCRAVGKARIAVCGQKSREVKETRELLEDILKAGGR